METIGQILGVISCILAFVLYQMKERKHLLCVQTAMTVAMAAHYFCLKAYPAMAMNLFCIVRNLVYDRKDLFKGRIYPIAMSLIMLVIGLLTATGAWSALVIVGLVVNTYCLSFDNPQHFRLSIFVTSPMVLIYDVAVFSVGGMLLEAISIVSAAIGYARYSQHGARLLHRGACAK